MAVENMMLEHLKRFQKTLERIESTQREQSHRLSLIEESLARLTQADSHHDATYASLSVRLDRVNDRLDRIERRLELA